MTHTFIKSDLLLRGGARARPLAQDTLGATICSQIMVPNASRSHERLELNVCAGAGVLFASIFNFASISKRFGVCLAGSASAPVVFIRMNHLDEDNRRSDTHASAQVDCIRVDSVYRDQFAFRPSVVRSSSRMI